MHPFLALRQRGSPNCGSPKLRYSRAATLTKGTDGRHLRILAIADDDSRETLVLVADILLSGQPVARELDQITADWLI